MKVFHGIENIAGAAGVLAKTQRDIGLDALSYCLPSSFQYQTDRTIKASSNFDVTLELLLFMLKQGWRFDVFQFYFGHSLTNTDLIDIPWLKWLGKKVYFYFCGCDIRDSKTVIAKYEFSACKDHWPMACSANRKKAIDMARRYADGIFVSTPDLLEFIPGSIWLPQPLDMNWFKPIRDRAIANLPYSRRDNQKIRIAHAPSDRMIKGSAYLEQAVVNLQALGYPVELLLVENTPYEEALQLCASADLVVDQLLVGAYGTFAVEMMALGKPVICYLREDLYQYYPKEIPIVSANPNSIGQILKDLIEHPERWDEMGQAGMGYVDRFHDGLVVGKRMAQYYQGKE